MCVCVCVCVCVRTHKHSYILRLAFVRNTVGKAAYASSRQRREKTRKQSVY